LGLENPCFNSGFLLLDLPALRSSGLIETALEILTKRPESCRWHDQSALNYAANGRCKLLGQEWNTQIHRTCFDPVSTIDALANRSINPHFVTKAKPWLACCPNPADKMFRILLDAVDPQWRTPEFNAREKSSRRKYRHAGSLVRIFHARAALKKTFGYDSASDTRTAEFWSLCSSDARRFRRRAGELKSLFEGWREEIELGLA
jgi:lipopolysaccharide biosynthesis glycosyltransferase